MSPPGRRRSRENERHPEPVGGVVAALLDRLGIREQVERSATAARWEHVVGPHIAGVTTVGGVRSRTLYIEVAGAVWMLELNMMRKELLRRLNEDRRRGRLDTIVFLQSGQSSPPVAVGGRIDKGRG